MSQSYLNKLKEILLILFQTHDYRYDLETINSLILICKTLVRDDIIKRIRNISILNQFLNISILNPFSNLQELEMTECNISIR